MSFSITESLPFGNAKSMPFGDLPIGKRKSGTMNAADLDVENRRRQLKKWIDDHFPNAAAFVRAHGLNQGEISGLLKTKSFGEKKARNLEEQAGMPSKYLDQRDDQPAASRLPLVGGDVLVWNTPEDLPPDPDRVWIDRWDYFCSAGDGGVQWEVRQKNALPFTQEFFKAIGSKPAHCKLLMVRGDSMEPLLFNKDMMMVDSTKTAIKDGGVYAVCFEDEPLVKQVFRQAGGALTLHSYNPKYPDRVIPASEMGSLVIIGALVYRSGSGFAGG